MCYEKEDFIGDSHEWTTEEGIGRSSTGTVSYTHLTLPTN